MLSLKAAAAINVYVVRFGFLVEKEKENAAMGKLIEI